MLRSYTDALEDMQWSTPLSKLTAQPAKYDEGCAQFQKLFGLMLDLRSPYVYQVVPSSRLYGLCGYGTLASNLNLLATHCDRADCCACFDAYTEMKHALRGLSRNAETVATRRPLITPPLPPYSSILRYEDEDEEDLDHTGSVTTRTDRVLSMPPISLLIKPIEVRFGYHFSGRRETNRIDKPEWMFTYALNILRDHQELLREIVQPQLDARGIGANATVRNGHVVGPVGCPWVAPVGANG